MLQELILKNRSYRGFDSSVVVTREQLLDMVDCARLSPFSQNFQSFRYFLSCDADTNAIIQPLTGWARALPDRVLPKPGEEPTAFLVMCYDNTIGPGAQRFLKDVGIAAQSILLRATEMGLGGIMIGNFSAQKVAEALKLPENLEVQLIIAIGKPMETVVLCDVGEDGNVNYYRDENDVHYVPKRKLADLVIN